MFESRNRNSLAIPSPSGLGEGPFVPPHRTSYPLAILSCMLVGTSGVQRHDNRSRARCLHWSRLDLSPAGGRPMNRLLLPFRWTPESFNAAASKSRKRPASARAPSDHASVYRFYSRGGVYVRGEILFQHGGKQGKWTFDASTTA